MLASFSIPYLLRLYIAASWRIEHCNLSHIKRNIEKNGFQQDNLGVKKTMFPLKPFAGILLSVIPSLRLSEAEVVSNRS